MVTWTMLIIGCVLGYIMSFTLVMGALTIISFVVSISLYTILWISAIVSYIYIGVSLINFLYRKG